MRRTRKNKGGNLIQPLEKQEQILKKQTEEKVLASEKIQNLLEGKAVRKLIVVPDRLVNLVV